MKRAGILTVCLLLGLGWGIAPVQWYVALAAAGISLATWALWCALARGGRR